MIDLYANILLHRFVNVWFRIAVGHNNTQEAKAGQKYIIILDNKCLELTNLPIHNTFHERDFHEEFSRNYTNGAQNFRNN